MYRGRGEYAVTIPAGAGAAASPVLTSHVRLRGWSIAALTTTSETGAVDADFAAAAAATATLPVGASLVGFTVTTASSAAVVNYAVTVTNVTGGPLNFTMQSPNGGNSGAILAPPIPVPLAPNGGQIAVSMAATVGGSAGHIVAYYTLGTTEATVTLFDGAQELAVIPVVPGSPANFDIGDEGVYTGTQLNVTVTGGTVAGVVWVSDVGPDDEEGIGWRDKLSSSPSPSPPAPQ